MKPWIRRAALSIFLLCIYSTGIFAQGNLGTCTVTDNHSGEPVVIVNQLQDIKLSNCPNLNRYVTQDNYQLKLRLQAEPSGTQSGPFAGAALISRNEVLFRTPFGSTGSTRLILWVLGVGSYVVNFTPPVLSSAPIILGIKSFAIERIEVPSAPIIDGVLQRTRIRYLIKFRMQRVGAGGTGLFHFLKSDGTELQRLGQIYPASSALAEPEGVTEIYDDELAGLTGVFVTDPNDESVPPSNIFPLTAAVPST